MKRNYLAVMTITGLWIIALFIALPVNARPSSAAQAFTYDPQVAEMLAQVQAAQVNTYDAQLSGETSIIVGGNPYTLSTRHTNSGLPVQQATQYVYEHLQRQGLAVSYHNWANCATTGRNVIGVLTGTLTPTQIVLITAHLDNMPSGSRAPGADDNASGSVGVMLAAEIMKNYRFERTVRFVFFTGEEQGLCGSEVYADAVFANGDNIIAVYNLDMIAYNDIGGPTLRIHTRTPSSGGYAGDLAIAGVFTNVVNTYGLGSVLTPIIDADGESASDHASFWQNGYPAVLAIEDDVNDFNAYYHTINDNLSHVNLPYFTNYVKASIGTVAHLARPYVTQGILRGSVVDGTTQNPIGGARVTASSIITAPVITQTNPSGQYLLSLLNGTYTVSAAAYGYLPAQFAEITLAANTTTTLNFTLTPNAFYTVTGVVQDALTSKPLSATITIEGYPGAPLNTDENGQYAIALSADVTYTFQVAANVNGYAASVRSIGPLNANRVEDFRLDPDLAACLAPDYILIGVNESFNSPITPTNWTVSGTSAGWRFNNPGGRANLTGGTRSMAIADSAYFGAGVSMDSELRTPALDFTTLSTVTLRFKTHLVYVAGGSAEVADVDVSVDGGATWANVWQRTASVNGPSSQEIDLSAQVAGHANVIVRFHYYNASADGYWEVDNVFAGQCVLRDYGLSAAAPVNEQSARNGQTVTYTIQLTNTGNVSSTFHFSATEQLWPTHLPADVILGARDSAAVDVSVDLPADALGGAHDVAQLRVNLLENPASQQSLILTTTAQTIYDFAWSAPQLDQSGRAGESITYTLLLTNTGNVSSTLHFSATGQTWPTTLPADVVLGVDENAAVHIIVDIPVEAVSRQSDQVWIQALVLENPSTQQLLKLSTSVAGARLYLPIIKR